jgi:hypothetical protein
MQVGTQVIRTLPTRGSPRFDKTPQTAGDLKAVCTLQYPNGPSAHPTNRSEVPRRPVFSKLPCARGLPCWEPTTYAPAQSNVHAGTPRAMVPCL